MRFCVRVGSPVTLSLPYHCAFFPPCSPSIPAGTEETRRESERAQHRSNPIQYFLLSPVASRGFSLGHVGKTVSLSLPTGLPRERERNTSPVHRRREDRAPAERHTEAQGVLLFLGSREPHCAELPASGRPIFLSQHNAYGIPMQLCEWRSLSFSLSNNNTVGFLNRRRRDLLWLPTVASPVSQLGRRKGGRISDRLITRHKSNVSSEVREMKVALFSLFCLSLLRLSFLFQFGQRKNLGLTPRSTVSLSGILLYSPVTGMTHTRRSFEAFARSGFAR